MLTKEPLHIAVGKARTSLREPEFSCCQLVQEFPRILFICLLGIVLKALELLRTPRQHVELMKLRSIASDTQAGV